MMHLERPVEFAAALAEHLRCRVFGMLIPPTERGDDLKHVASEADAKLEAAQRAMRAAVAVKRRNEINAADASLQSQLRAEAQARRDQAARERFGIQARLEPYSTEELAAIVVRAARILEVELDGAGAHAIASRSRGTPRVANRLLKRARDYAEVRGSGIVTEGAAQAALELLEVDELGLDRLDRAILRAICEKFTGGPVGLSTLAVAVGEERDTIEDVYEPYLLQLGMLKRTPRGRTATAHAYEHLDITMPAVAPALF